MSENATPDPGSLRVGDHEREDAVRLLDGHFSAGRLTADERTERVNAAYAARTRDDLDQLFADLPGDQWTGADTGAAEATEPTAHGCCAAAWWHGERVGPPRWLPILLLILVLGLLGSARVLPPFLAPLLIIAAVVFSRRCRHHHQHHRHHHHHHQPPHRDQQSHRHER